MSRAEEIYENYNPSRERTAVENDTMELSKRKNKNEQQLEQVLNEIDISKKLREYKLKQVGPYEKAIR